MRTLTGKVVSVKMANTAVVVVERLIKHPIYHKQMQRTKKFHAHNELKLAVGDTVTIGEIKPVSKTKNWKVIEKVNLHGTA
jgi:small subunit ribosomal protein S17